MSTQNNIPLIAQLPKFGKINNCDIYPKHPTFRKGHPSNKTYSWLDVYASLTIRTYLYDHGWTNWDEETLDFQFEMFTGYKPNALREGTPPDLKTSVHDVFTSFIANYLQLIFDAIGESPNIIEKKFKSPSDIKAFNYNDTHYIEISKHLEEDHTFNHVILSKIVTLPTGSKRAKLYRTTQSVHKSGNLISFKDFVYTITNDLNTAFSTINAKFENNLKGL